MERRSLPHGNRPVTPVPLRSRRGGKDEGGLQGLGGWAGRCQGGRAACLGDKRGTLGCSPRALQSSGTQASRELPERDEGLSR